MTKPFTFAYQHTPAASKCNAFCWNDGQPSIFRGRSFTVDDAGMQTRANERYERENGKSRGTVRGVSAKADALIDERQAMRGRAPGRYRG